MKKHFAYLLLLLFISIDIPAWAGNIGSDIGKTIGSSIPAKKQIGNGFSINDVSIIEYDTYGEKSGYYIEDGFGTTTKYDINGKVLSRYKTNQRGKTYVYDKYGHVAGYFLPIEANRTNIYDKEDTPLGYFTTDSDGLVKKYDTDGNHLNTYIRQK